MMVLYRYERDPFYANGYKPAEMRLQSFQVIKETEKSYIILLFGITRKRVSKTGKKRYAYPTEDEALINFHKRTERCVKILEAQLERAKAFLRTSEHKLNEKQWV